MAKNIYQHENHQNNFEKEFFKLMNNSVFKKTMENVENNVDVKLVTDEKQASKLVAQINHNRCTIFNDNLAEIHMKKTKLFYGKSIYWGMCILDLSETFMYDFHYDYIKTKYGNRVTLLFTNTNSVVYVIQTNDIYADITENFDARFNTSEYPKDHPSEKKLVLMRKCLECLRTKQHVNRLKNLLD